MKKIKRYYFQRAKAIWAEKREEEMNCELAVKAVVPQKVGTVLCIAASSVYRIWINGEFVAAGPARAAHGYYRVDEHDITKYLSKKENIVVIEVVGYNVNSYDTLDQKAFVTVEIKQDEDVFAWTGGNGFDLYDLKQRIQKIQRYSFQRAFIDGYRLKKDKRSFYTEIGFEWPREKQVICDEKKYLYRESVIPCFEKITASLLAGGTVYHTGERNDLISEEYYFQVSPTLKGYKREETEIHVSEETQKFISVPGKIAEEIKDGYLLYQFSYNATGFYQVELEAFTESKIYVLFDELAKDNDINFLRMYSCNSFYYEVEAGAYTLMSFAPYVMKYVKIIVIGNAKIKKVGLVEYKNSQLLKKITVPEEENELKLIQRAAEESFRSNSLDLFMDCPSRERAGWLCDSYFTAEVEKILTGKNEIEKVFLENYLMADQFAYLPDGMLPMCYPADHNNGVFIPNWSMWFVLELERYKERTGDNSLVMQAKKKIYKLLKYFEKYENQEGFLENLDGWIFIEWSRANDDELVQGVNFPTNMLYMRMLLAVSELYKDDKTKQKALLLREKIRKYSLRGIFFKDHLGLDITTEVCQYYAFFTGTATFEEDDVLWDTLIKDFGENRNIEKQYPEIAPSNFFIGIYLRIELLYRSGLYEEMLQNIKDYFLPMAMATGTLWEHIQPTGSCNHGFASYILYWLDKIYA